MFNPRKMALAFLAFVVGLMALVAPVSSASASIPGCLAAPIVGIGSTPDGKGYWDVGADGGVFAFGSARYFGGMAGKHLNAPIVGIVATASGNGYWLIAADGGTFAFGDAKAPSSNPLPGMHLNAPIVGAARIGTNGLELAAGDGGVFALGGAPFYGSMAGHHLNRSVVAIVVTASGHGYWLVAGDGGVFAFGDAQSPANNPLPAKNLDDNHLVVGAVRYANTNGLWLTAKDGGVFALGGAPFYGSMAGKTLAKPVSGITAPPNGSGYWLTAGDGGVFAYHVGFFGNAVSTGCPVITPPPSINSKIVQIATDLKNGQAKYGWRGGPIPYSWGAGHGSQPGPSYGTCYGYTGSIKPCPATHTFGDDCSGFSRWVYATAYGRDVFGGVNTNGQVARMVRDSSPHAGDLVFYGTGPSKTHHVGVYIGNGQMINALKTGTNVRVDSVSVMGDVVGYYHM